MNSQDIINAVETVVQNNRAKIGNMINALNGGWEVWLQVETALQLYGNLMLGAAAQREYPYPGVVQRCDILLTPRLGANIYMELKVQNAAFDNIIDRFRNDITKIRQLPGVLRSQNTMIAIAYMESFNPIDLMNVRKHEGVMVGSFSVYQYNGINWETTTGNPVSGNPTIALFKDYTPPDMMN